MRPDPDALLAAVQAETAREARGRLKIFLGANAGVGKTYAMLQEARARRALGEDVVAGLVETHARAETEALLEGLEVLPRRRIEHRGAVLQEFDLDAALARRPARLLVDELAHSNAPGSRHLKRWQDIEDLLAAGIDVDTTVNVQHLESLNDQIARLTGVQVWETVPDRLVAEADEVELVDIPTEELLERLRSGKIYDAARAAMAGENFFSRANLIALREIALRETAARVDHDLTAQRARDGRSEPARVSERVLACIGADEFAPQVVREAARLAAALRAPWTALYVETPRLAHAPEADRERVLATLRLAESLGADSATLGSVDIARTVLDFAAERGATRIVIGAPTRRPWLRRFAGSLVDTLVSQARGVAIQVIAQQAGADILGNRGQSARVTGLSRPRKSRPRVIRYLAALGLVAAAIGIAALSTPELPESGVVMLFLLAVVVAGLQLGRGPATLAAVVGDLGYNFFFTEPRYTFEISGVEDVLTFLVLLLVGLVIAQLSARARHQTRVALQREERAVAMGAFTERLLAASGEAQLATSAAEFLASGFDADVAVLLPGTDLTLGTGARVDHLDPPVQVDLSIARWVFDRAQPAGLGTDTLPSAARHYVPLVAGQRCYGVLALAPHELRRLLLPEPRRALEQCARQVAVALERHQLIAHTQDSRLAAQEESLRNALLSGLSHDLRTPLASIVGASSALLGSPGALATPAARELANSVHDEAQRMSRLASNLLELARVTADGASARCEWIPVEELIGAVRHRLGAMLAKRRIEVRIGTDAQLSWVDGLLFEQALTNLLENALKYTPAGTDISLDVRRDEFEGRTALRLDVSDRGPGVPDELKQAVFRKFFRGAPEGAQGGAGLGLALASAIVSLHGGRMWVEDRPGGGATFVSLWPLPAGEPPLASEREHP